MDIFLGYVRAFVVGGLFCVVAQILIDKTKLTPARILVAYVIAGVILGGIGVYGPLVEYAGGGASVPLTGFGYTISRGVRDAVDTIGLLGAFTGGLTASAAGLSTALIFGLGASLIFPTKSKG